MDGPSVKVLFISSFFTIPYIVDCVHIGSSDLNKSICQNSFDDLRKFFVIHKMYDCLCIIMKEINIVFVSVIICSIADNLINTST